MSNLETLTAEIETANRNLGAALAKLAQSPLDPELQRATDRAFEKFNDAQQRYANAKPGL